MILIAGCTGVMPANAQTAVSAPAAQGSGTTNSYVVLPNNIDGTGALRVTEISATSDKAGSKIQFYKPYGLVQASVLYSTNAAVVQVGASALLFPAGHDVVYRQTSVGTYLHLTVVTNSVALGTVTLSATPGSGANQGDILYEVTKAGSIPLGATNVTLTGSCIYAGWPQWPLLIEADGTSACSVNSATATTN